MRFPLDPAMAPPSAQPADRSVILRTLPVFPAVALELIELIDQSGVGLRRITRLLGRDPGLSAEVLRYANSARFARRHGVSDLEEAVTLLGTEQTCRVAMGAACRGLVAPALGRAELRQCWEHCVATAILASTFAPTFGQHPGPAYAAGLLHDVGCLALVSVYPDRYVESLRAINEEGAPRLDAELRVFGVDHCTVGGWLVEDWQLPPELCQVIVSHHEKRPFDRSLLTLVATASVLSDLIQPHPVETPPWQDPAAFLETLPLDQAAALQQVERARAWIKTELS